MATNRYTGKNLYVAFKGQSLMSSGRSFEVTLEQETADATAGADNYRVFIPTVKNISASMEVLNESGATGSAIATALALDSNGTLLWGPEGTAAGKPKWGAVMRVTNASQSHPFDDVSTTSVEWSNAGTALAFDGSTAVWP